MKLSVITVSWNSAGKLRGLLRSLEVSRAGFPGELEVVVADNASRDETASMVLSEFPRAILVETGGNLGFAGGCNAGLRAATGEFLLLLNPDSIANAEAMAGMASYLGARRDAGAAGCRLLHDDGLPQRTIFAEVGAWSYWLEHSLISPLLESLAKRLRLGAQWATQPADVDSLMGACLMVRRDVYEKAGPMEESYFLYSEDTDWCRRIRDAGFRIVYLPQFELKHSQRDSANRLPEYCFRRLYRSLLEYSARFNPPAVHRRFLRAVVLDMTLRLPLYWMMEKLSTRGGLGERRESVRSVRLAFAGNDPALLAEPVPSA